MKLAIMQPYLFPYIGYFQLVAAVDKFIFYDDVNFRKNSWINRNRFLLNGQLKYFTVPLFGASQSKKINQIIIQKDDFWEKKILESVRHSYSKAKNFAVISNLLSEVMFTGEEHISAMARKSVMAVSRYLGMKTEFVMSSSCYGNAGLKGVDRILDICHKENAGQYFNLPNGRALYDEKLFKLNGVDLHFIQSRLNKYSQFSKEFYPGLSIIDVLMFIDKDVVREMLNEKIVS